LKTNNIISGCQNKRPEAQKALVQRYSGLLFTICRRYCYREMDARDVLQDAFIIIFKNFHQYDVAKGMLDAWLKRVTINVALQHNRSKKIFPLPINEEVNQVESDEPMAIDKMTADEIIALVAKLPTQYRTVFNLKVIDGFSHKEIAAQLGISTKTIENQITKALKLIRKAVDEYNGLGILLLSFFT